MKPLAELTSHCIRCGFCLEACPTFTETASELESPRGRIYLVRSADEGKIQWEDARPHLDRCLGCRACETACPSGVEYGAILEIARDRLNRLRPNAARKFLLKTTTTPVLLRFNLAAGRLLGPKVPEPFSRMISGQSPEANQPVAQRVGNFSPLNGENLPEVRGEVYLLEGCAMRVLYPRVHQATRRLLRRVGFTVREVSQGCCGAMHSHNGELADARGKAQALVAAMPGDLPIIVNSAGCGSTMKEYESLIGPEAEAFAARVTDLSEFLLENGLKERLAEAPGLGEPVTYHDACHLAHGQKIRSQPRELIQAMPNVDYRELGEADTCCGSAGIYNLTQPALARQLIERKYRHIQATGATLVATGNPGCHAWIAQAAAEHGQSVRVLHTAELLEMAFDAGPFTA